MAGVDEAAIFAAHCALVADHVGPGAAKAGRTHCLVGVHHDMVLGGLDDGVVIVIDERLAVVMLAVRDDISHITALYGIVSVLVHQGVGLLHPALVINCGRRAFVVHHKADALLVRIGVKCRQVEVRIRSDKVEDEVLLMAEPVFPAFVPAFDKEGVEAVLGCKVYVPAYVVVIGAMQPVRLGRCIVGYAKLHRREVESVRPLVSSGNQLPPYAHVLHRMDPADIVQGAGLVKVQNKAGCKHVCGRFTHHYGAPWAVARGLETTFHTLCIGGKPGTENELGVIQNQISGRIVQNFCLVDIDVQAFGGFHLKGCLYASVREAALRGIVQTHTA